MNPTAPKLPEDPDEGVVHDAYPAHAWYVAHQAELREKYGRGARVAISPARGVVAAGTLEQVQAALHAAGEAREDSDVVIFAVR